MDKIVKRGDHGANLSRIEVNAFIDEVVSRWTGEDRRAFARKYPAIYCKIEPEHGPGLVRALFAAPEKEEG